MKGSEGSGRAVPEGLVELVVRNQERRGEGGTPAVGGLSDGGARALVVGVLRAVLDAGWSLGPPRQLDAEVERDAESYRRRAASLLRVGEPLEAYDLVVEALAHWPEDRELARLQALALARSGAPGPANALLRELRDEGRADPEALAALARTHKDLAAAADDDASRRRHLDSAASIYEAAYRLERGAGGDAAYPGINAATLHLLRGDSRRAADIAADVAGLCSAQLRTATGDPFWTHATLGEAALVRGELDEAKREYARAAELAGRRGAGRRDAGRQGVGHEAPDPRHADVSTARRQARLLVDHLGEDPAWVDRLLVVPPVVLFTGHLLDGPDRVSPRFPQALVEPVRLEIRRRLEATRPLAVYCSAACGADLLFLEEALVLGGEVHVVLPFPRREFRRECVEIAGGDWGERFDRVLVAAESVVVASDHRASGSESTYQYANLLLTGLGELRRRALDTDLLAMAVWDGKHSHTIAGTSWLIGHWRDHGIEVDAIDLEALAGVGAPATTVEAPSSPSEDRDQVFSHEVKAILFADAVRFSRLSEDQIPLFVEHFWGPIAELLAACPDPPLLRETAGDGLFLVFSSAQAAGDVALRIAETACDRPWRELGLPESLNLRIALHVGPVYSFVDPVTGRPSYTGPHASRTARIEPITPPGQVYASDVFAAVALATGVRGLAFEYVGRTDLAKQAGSMPLYHVVRSATGRACQ